MAKKYLSLEEAARHAGVSVEQLKQLRERGEIRGFSDGGTWKFKTDDVEEMIRSRQPDSNPDVPLLTDEALDQDSSIIGMEEEDLVSEQPTVIRGNSALDDDDDDSFLVGMTSDSDVQLIPNELLTDDGHADMVSMGNSDSDVRLVDLSAPLLIEPGSDSDVKLVGGSDSDVQIVGGSDSDVRIMEDDSDSDVKLVPDVKTEHDIPTLEDDSDSDVALVAPAGSGVSLDMHDTDASVFEDDESGISLGDGSSITLAAESGISLEKIDSDLELKQKAGKKAGDSGLDLSTDDSGISLEGFDDDDNETELDEDDFIGLAEDSGIELSPADSGIALESLADSGIALDSGNAPGRTVPMRAHGSRDPDADDTAMEMPTLDEDSEYELSMDGATSGDTSNIIMFDEEEEFDDRQATVIKKGKAGRAEPSEEFDLTGDGGDFDLDDSFEEFDEDDDFAGAAVADEDDLDVADDVVGEDDELDDLDVFDEGADDFDDDFDAGTSKPDFVAGGLGASAAAIPAPVQSDWGTGPFVGLLFSTLLMAMCGMMMFDLVRSMWSWNEPSTFNSPLLGIVRDLIK